MAHLGGTFALLALLALGAFAQTPGSRPLLAMAPRSFVRGEAWVLPPGEGTPQGDDKAEARRKGPARGPTVYPSLREDALPLAVPPLRDASTGVRL